MPRNGHGRKHVNTTQIQVNRASGYTAGTFECPYCFQIGSSRKGGKNRHLKKCYKAPSNTHFQRVSSPESTISTPSSEETSSSGSSDLDSPVPEPAVTSKHRTTQGPRCIDSEPPKDYYSPQYIMDQDGDIDMEPGNNINPAEDLDVDAPQYVLGLEEVHVQKHPFANSRPTLGPRTHRPRDYLPPYWPFETKDDVDQASLFLKSNHSISDINEQLRIIHRRKGTGEGISFKNAEEFHAILDKAIEFDENKFTESDIVTKFRGKEFKFTMYSRNLHDAVQSIVGDPDLFDYLRLDAERVTVRHPDGTRNMRVYEEYWQGEDMWDLQSAIGPNSRPLPLIIYADETTLTSFGNITLWPIYLWLGNLPSSIRAARGKGGAVLVGYLPKVNNQAGLTKAQHSELRDLVYHQCFRLLFQSIEVSSTVGDVFMFGDGRTRHCTTPVAALPNDYPELCRIYRNRGLHGACPCPRCLVPKDLLGETQHDWSERQPLAQLRQNTKGLSAETIKSACKRMGLKGLDNAFEFVTDRFLSLNRTLCFDCLHMYGNGEFGRWWLKGLVKNLSERQKNLIDDQFKAIPSHPGVTHFAQGVLSLKWRSATDNYWISRLLVPNLEDTLSPKRPSTRPILKVFRLLGECTALVKFTTHTDASLELLQEKLDCVEREAQNLLPHWPTFHLNTFKFHFNHQHLVSAIREKGPIDCTDTGIGEAQHPQSKRDYLKTSRQRGEWQLQMLKRSLRRSVMAEVKARIACRVNQAPQEIGDREYDTDPAHRIRFGSTLPPISLLRFLRIIFPSRFRDVDTDRLVEALQRFLYRHFPSLRQPGITRPQVQHLPHLSTYTVQEARTAYISYVSTLDSSLQTDQIRCTDAWRKSGPRHDYVLISSTADRLSYAQVMGLFTLRLGKEPQRIAIIRELVAPARNSSTGFIQAGEPQMYSFVFAGTFVRSVLVHPPGDSYRTKYVVNDLLDSDMYLRLKST